MVNMVVVGRVLGARAGGEAGTIHTNTPIHNTVQSTAVLNAMQTAYGLNPPSFSPDLSTLHIPRALGPLVSPAYPTAASDS